MYETPSNQDSQVPDSLGQFAWHYLANHKLLLATMLFVGFSWCGIMVSQPYVLKLIVDASASSTPNPDDFRFYSLIFVLLFFYEFLVTNFYKYINANHDPKIMAEIVADSHHYLMGHSYAYFQRNFMRNLTRKIFDLSSNFENLVKIPSDLFLVGGLRLIMAAVILYFSLPPAFSISITLWGVVFVFVTYKLSRRSKDHAMVMSESDHQVGGLLSDSISNIISVKLFAGSAHEQRQLSGKLSQYVDNAKKFHYNVLFVNCIQGLFVVGLMGLMLSLLVQYYSSNQITPGDFALVIMLSNTLVTCIYMLGREIVDYSKIVGTMSQALTQLKEPHEITDAADAKPLTIQDGKIDFYQVSFNYNNVQPLFADLNLHIAAKQKVGLVSLSGGGKSTLVKLLLRLYDLHSGHIFVDEQDIRFVKKDSLRQQIAMIPQDPELFHRTIMDNIRFSNPTASDDAVVLAAQQAQCDDFIRALPLQYQAMVGEKGVKLSGGQRQRIAIARAILKDAPILILDEATSSLDSVTEHYIQQGLEVAMQNKTVIVIAHRLSTLNNMDRIVVLEQGNIVEDGTIKGLLEKPGLFYQLWQMQSDGLIGNTVKESRV